MTFGLVLFGLVAVASIVGSLTPAIGEAVYGSWWFTALLFALVLNTGLCAIVRRPGIGGGKGRGGRGLRGWSVFGIHLAILAIAAASLWAGLAFTTERLEVGAGEVFEVEGRTVTFEALEVERYPDGSVSDWVGSLGLEAGTVELRVNHPARIGTSRVLLVSVSREYAMDLMLPGEAEPTAFILPQGAFLPLTRDGAVTLSVRGGNQAADGTPPVSVILARGGTVLEEVVLAMGERAELGSTGIVAGFDAQRPVASFIVRRTPGIGFLWAGFALLSLAVCLFMLSSTVTEVPGGKKGRPGDLAGTPGREKGQENPARRP